MYNYNNKFWGVGHVYTTNLAQPKTLKLSYDTESGVWTTVVDTTEGTVVNIMSIFGIC